MTSDANQTSSGSLDSDSRKFREEVKEELKKIPRGSLIWEFVLIGALAVVAILFFLKPAVERMLSAREDEAKANLHLIQVAIERYATDRNYYPVFLYGGDIHSTFTTDRSDLEPRNEGRGLDLEFSDYTGDPRAVLGDCDAFLQYGYLDEYPQNPFSRRMRRGERHLVTDPCDAPKSRIKVSLSQFGAVPRAGCLELGDVNNWQFALPRCPAGVDGQRMWDVTEGRRHPPFALLAPGERAGGYYAPSNKYNAAITADMHDDEGANGSTVNATKAKLLHPNLPGNFYYYAVEPSPRGWSYYYPGISYSPEIIGYRLAVYGPADNPGQDVYDMFGDFEDRQISEYIDDQNTTGVDVPNLGGPDGRPDGVLMVLTSAMDAAQAIRDDLRKEEAD